MVIVKVKPETSVDVLAKLTPAQLNYFGKLESQGKIEKIYHMVGQQAFMIVCDVQSEEELSKLISQDPMFFFVEREIYPLITMEEHKKVIKELLGKP